jgi:hypothetical protein
MKKLAFICLLLASLHARADIVIVEDAQTTIPDKSAAGSHTIESKNAIIKFKDGKFREDITFNANPISFITDPATGEVLELDHERKLISRDPVHMLNGRAVGVTTADLKADAARHGGAPDYTDTGKQEKIGDYNAEIYTLEWRGVKFTVWISKEVPDYAFIRDQLKILHFMKGQLVLPVLFRDISPRTRMADGDAREAASRIDGVPVKFTVVAPDGQTFTSTIVSLKQQPVDAADFKVPADYIEQAPPQGASTASTGPVAPPR